MLVEGSRRAVSESESSVMEVVEAGFNQAEWEDKLTSLAATDKYDLIVTISTLEHVGWDEEPRDPSKVLRAIENLKSCYADPEREMLRKEEAAMVRRAFESLADMHREILILRTYGDASYSEIAEILSIPEGTVMSRLYNARMKLKSIIQSMEGEENYGL